MLGALLKSIFLPRRESPHDEAVPAPARAAAQAPSGKKKVLNVGGQSKEIAIPSQYDGWQHDLLDIDPESGADIVCDARELTGLPPGEYDSVHCSHNLEHYYRHDVARVLAGFVHVLKEDGFVYIRVPDMGELMRVVVKDGLDIDDVLYQSAAGPITVKDVIYGYGAEIEESGNDFYAHKTGFTQKSLAKTLVNAGFPFVFTGVGNLEVTAIGFKNQPQPESVALFGIPGPTRAVPGD